MDAITSMQEIEIIFDYLLDPLSNGEKVKAYVNNLLDQGIWYEGFDFAVTTKSERCDCERLVKALLRRNNLPTDWINALKHVNNHFHGWLWGMPYVHFIDRKNVLVCDGYTLLRYSVMDLKWISEPCGNGIGRIEGVFEGVVRGLCGECDGTPFELDYHTGEVLFS